MESLQDIIERQQQASPRYFEDGQKDAMMATILSLAEEICVLRDRLDTCRRLAAEGKASTDSAIDAFTVSEEALEQRLAEHTEFFEATLARVVSDP
jgi:hypothetical protein